MKTGWQNYRKISIIYTWIAIESNTECWSKSCFYSCTKSNRQTESRHKNDFKWLTIHQFIQFYALVPSWDSLS